MSDDELNAKLQDLQSKIGELEAAAKEKQESSAVATRRMAYSEYGSQIRHFSTIRSTLTTFLVTAGMTSFAGYLDKKIVFLFFAGLVFAAAAIIVCFWFSYRTEKAVIRYKDEWKELRPVAAQTSKLPWRKKVFVDLKQSIGGRMVIDLMNWLLILAAGSFIWIAMHNFPPPAPSPDDRSWSE